MTLEFIYQDGNIRMIASWVDYSGISTSPTSQRLSIFDPRGSYAISGYTSPTQSTSGVFFYDYNSPASGTIGAYTVWWVSTTGSFDDVVRGQFEVKGL